MAADQIQVHDSPGRGKQGRALTERAEAVAQARQGLEEQRAVVAGLHPGLGSLAGVRVVPASPAQAAVQGTAGKTAGRAGGRAGGRSSWGAGQVGGGLVLGQADAPRQRALKEAGARAFLHSRQREAEEAALQHERGTDLGFVPCCCKLQVWDISTTGLSVGGALNASLWQMRAFDVMQCRKD